MQHTFTNARSHTTPRLNWQALHMVSTVQPQALPRYLTENSREGTCNPLTRLSQPRLPKSTSQKQRVSQEQLLARYEPHQHRQTDISNLPQLHIGSTHLRGISAHHKDLAKLFRASKKIRCPHEDPFTGPQHTRRLVLPAPSHRLELR